jgi:hypothetical protein
MQAYMKQGALVMNDNLEAPDQYPWGRKSGSGYFCGYMNENYHAQESQPLTYNQCLLQSPKNFTDFLFQATVQIIKGDDGGLVFRANPTTYVEYRFDVAANGTFDLIRQASNKAPQQLIKPTPSHTIHKGNSETNQLAVLTERTHVYLFVNGINVDTSTIGLSSGAIGFHAYDYSNPTDVVFLNAQLWTAPSGF